MVTGRPYDKTMRITSAVFTGLVDVTVLLGVVTLLSGTFYPALVGHITMMVLATIIAHVVSVVVKRRPEEERTYAPHLVGTLVVLGLIAAGIMAIGRPLVGS
jgi:small-conductance mechanosensitive channel